MHARTRSHKPKLVLGLEEGRRQRKIGKKKVEGERLREKSSSGPSEGSTKGFSLGSPNLETQPERNSSPFGLKSKESPKTDWSDRVNIEEVGTKERRATMAAPQGRQEQPSVSPIEPLVRPRGLPILVLQNLAAFDMPSNLHKFWGTKNEDPSRHMERYIEILARSLITAPGYCLVWFPPTLEGKAYKW